MKIVFDVDGVILNYAQSLQDFMVEHYGVKANVTFSSRQWFMKGRFDSDLIDKIGYKNIEKAFIQAGHFHTLMAMPQSDRIQEVLKKKLHEAYFVTSISPELHQSRLENLQKVIHPHLKSQQLICVAPHESKKPVIDKIKPDYFIEDSLKNLVQSYGEHTSIWVDLNEQKDTYDLNQLSQFDIHQVSHLNQALDIVLGQKKKLRS